MALRDTPIHVIPFRAPRLHVMFVLQKDLGDRCIRQNDQHDVVAVANRFSLSAEIKFLWVTRRGHANSM